MLPSGEKTKAQFKVRHTKNAFDVIERAHTALANLQEDVQTVEQKLNYLAKRKVTRESMTAILDRLFPKG